MKLLLDIGKFMLFSDESVSMNLYVLYSAVLLSPLHLNHFEGDGRIVFPPYRLTQLILLAMRSAGSLAEPFHGAHEPHHHQNKSTLTTYSGGEEISHGKCYRFTSRF